MASEILVKINVESGQAEVGLKKAKAGSDKLSKSFGVLANQTNKNVKEQASLTGEQKLATEQQKRLSYEMQNAGKIAAVYEQSTKKASSGTKQFRTQVGLNNAILTEAGRAASDLRFGFNGVANNVGQLASLFGSLINTSDNVLTSLKNLAKSLIGTGGVMIAIQLLIAYGDQIYNFFRGISESAAKAEKAMKKLEGAVQSQRIELLGYVDVLKDSTVSEEVRVNALKELNVVSKETIQDYKDGKISLDDLNLSVETYIKQQRLRGELEAILSSNQELFAEREKANSILRQMQFAKESGNLEEVKKLYEENTSFFERSTRSAEDLGISMADAFAGNTANSDFIKAFKTIIKGTVEEGDAAVKRIGEIQKELTAILGGGGTGGSTRIRIFKEKTLELEKLEQRYREKSVNKDLQTNQEKIAQFQQNEFAKLDILEESFITRESLRLKNYIESIENQKISDDKKLELIADAEAKFTKEVEQAGEDRLEVEKQILLNSQLMRDIQDRKNGEIGRKLQEKEQRIREAFEFKKLELQKTGIGNDALYFNARAVLLEKAIDLQQKITDNADLGSVERAEAEVKLFGLKDSLRQNDLKKELTAVEEKRRIQMEYVGFARGISSILGNIAGEDEEIKRAALLIEKGAAIADIVIKANASLAVSKFNLGTIPAFLSPGVPNPAKGLAIADTLKSDIRTKTSAAIGIASILATTLTSAKSPSGGAGGSSSGASVTAPSFNVVGASATNQLAQTVAGQINEPLRAYVVGSDISDQQELDRSIISTAGIG